MDEMTTTHTPIKTISEANKSTVFANIR